MEEVEEVEEEEGEEQEQEQDQEQEQEQELSQILTPHPCKVHSLANPFCSCKNLLIIMGQDTKWL